MIHSLFIYKLIISSQTAFKLKLRIAKLNILKWPSPQLKVGFVAE